MSQPIDCDEFRRWINQAEHTLRLIKSDIDAEGYDWACFKAQQAAENALKAALRSVGHYAFGHNLLALFRDVKEMCKIYDKEIEECIAYLDKLYLPPRYPDAFPEGYPAEHFTKLEAERAKSCAERVIAWVKRCIKECH